MAKLSFTLNGKPVNINVDGDRELLWIIRAELGQTGTKYGCGEAACGACTVLVDNNAVRSCIYPVRNVNGKEIITIEGLAKNEILHPLQQAFVDHDALQCGFCTPGMIMNGISLLLKDPESDRDKIIQGMDRNLCRCGAHVRIIQAIESAARKMREAKQS
jgi:carbon-monoxide dehydrogenase small subunit